MTICRRWENEEYALRDNGEPIAGLAVANKRALVAGLVSVVIVILGLVGYWQYDLRVSGPELFVDVPVSEQPATFRESSVAKRHRWVKLSPDALERLNTLGGKIRLNLFDDLQVTTEVAVRRFINGGMETSVGRLDNDPDTLMVMCRKTVRPGKLMGMVVDTFGTQYLITHEIDGKHVIVEVDQSKIFGCGGAIELEKAKQPKKTAATKPGLPATQVARQDSPEAKALRRLVVRGSEAQALLTPGGHTHRVGATCPDCRSFAEIKRHFKKAALNRTPKPGTSTPTPIRTGPSIEPVNTGSLNLLNAMSFNKPLLAAITPGMLAQSFGLWGKSGSVLQTASPTHPGILKHLRGGSTEYLDILFIYTALGLAGGTESDLRLSLTRSVEVCNTIFANCSIPLEVRVAGLTAAKCRAGWGDGTPGTVDFAALGGGPSAAGPAWKQDVAPVRPTYNPDSAGTPPVPVWVVHYGNTASVGRYSPLYQDFEPTGAGGMTNALRWLENTNNSLIYGDQYWGTAAGQWDPADPFAPSPPNPIPYINLPETVTWTIVPDYDNTELTGDDGAINTFGGTLPSGLRRTPELRTGPVDHPESSHALDYDQALGGNGHGGFGGVSHLPVFQYNLLAGPTAATVVADVDMDTIQWNAAVDGGNHGLATASVIHFRAAGTGAMPGGLVVNTDYYVRQGNASSELLDTHVSLYPSWNEALKNMNKIDITTVGTTPQMVRGSSSPPANAATYGQAFNVDTSAVVGYHGNVGALRMDFNSTMLDAQGQRYPNLHGAYQNFVANDHATARADMICLITGDLAPPEPRGLSNRFLSRGADPSPEGISGVTTNHPVDFNSTEVVNNRDLNTLDSRPGLCVVQSRYATAGYVLMHELGHMLGASRAIGDFEGGLGNAPLHPHDEEITFSPYDGGFNPVLDDFLSCGNHFMAWGGPDPITGLGPNASGFGATAAAAGGYCTIMAEPVPKPDGVTRYIRIPLYSSPKIFYRGELTGRMRGMFLPPPLSSYTTPLYMDNVQCITTVGLIAAYYRDSNGSGRPSGRTSVRHRPPVGRPADRGVKFSRNPNQANAKGGNSGTAAAGATTQVGPDGATNPTTNTNRPGIPLGGGSNPTLPVIPGGGLGGTTNNPGGGIGTTPTVPVLPINPAVPNDHRYSATKWRGGRWAKNNTTFATVINGHNNGATHENTERTHAAFHGKSVWWYIEWPANAPAITLKQLEATTKGSTFDTTLGVMYVPKGQLATQVPLNNQYFKWNNNTPGGVGPFSTVILPQVKLNPGDRVYFMVDGVGGATGRIRLGIKMEK